MEVEKNRDHDNTKTTKKIVLIAFMASKRKALLGCIYIIVALSFGYLGY